MVQLVSRHSCVADRLPVVRFSAGPRVRLKTSPTDSEIKVHYANYAMVRRNRMQYTDLAWGSAFRLYAISFLFLICCLALYRMANFPAIESLLNFVVITRMSISREDLLKMLQASVFGLQV